MARPVKPGIDYFPLDVSMDDKMELIEAKHGLVGFGIMIKLYQQIYRKNGYYLRATEERLLLFKRQVNVDINLINAVIEDALGWGLFDKRLYRKYGILTSKGVQKRFVEATKRRKEVEFIKEFLLIEDIQSFYSDRVNVNINSINAGINSENGNSGTQSKVNKTKVNKSIITSPSGDSSPDFDPELPSGSDQDPPVKEKNNTPNCPQEEIKQLYHEELPELPPIRVWGEISQKNLRARWREDPERQSLDWWRRFFREYIRSSDFLMGRKRDFQASLDWIVKPMSFQKIMNGMYVNRNGSGGSSKPDRTSFSEKYKDYDDLDEVTNYA